MNNFTIILAVAVATVQGFRFEDELPDSQSFARTGVIRQYRSGGERRGGGGWGAGQQQPISGNGGYGGNSGGKPQKPIIDAAPVSGGGGYGGASTPLKPVVPSFGGPKPSISRPSGSVSGYLSGDSGAPVPAPAQLKPAPVVKPVAADPAFGSSGFSDLSGGGAGYDEDSYSAPPQIKPGYSVPETAPSGPVGYGR